MHHIKKLKKITVTKKDVNKLHEDGKLIISSSPCSGASCFGWVGTLYEVLLFEDGKYFLQEYYLADGNQQYMTPEADDFDEYGKKEEVIILIEDN